MGFEDFEPIIGEVKAEWGETGPNSGNPLHPCLFRIFSDDPSYLKFHVTDFRSYTWAAVKSVHQIEDMRDYVGIGGQLSEFIDYFITSFKFGDVKLVYEGSSKSNEQERCCQLTRVISAEKEKSQTIRNQLDALVSSKRLKLDKTSPDIANMSIFANSDTSSVSVGQNSTEKQTTAEFQSSKIASRVVPAYRRSKVRGVVLQDTEEGEEN